MKTVNPPTTAKSGTRPEGAPDLTYQNVSEVFMFLSEKLPEY